MRSNLDSDPDVIAIGVRLNLDELAVVGRLWKVWSWADQHTTDGNAVRVTEVTLDRFANCSGFAAAMREVGWLEGRDGALTFPRFDRHNGQTAKNRALTAQRVAKRRNAESVTNVTPPSLPEERRVEKNRRIPTLTDALAHGAGHQPKWEEGMIREWFAHRDGQNWERTSGLPISNWRSDLDGWCMKNERERNNEATRGSGGPSVINAASTNRKAAGQY